MHNSKLGFLAFGLAKLISAQDTESCDFKWLTQKVDHFGNSNGTFQQRYNVFPEFFKPGGPILMFQGEEGVGDCVNTTIMYDFAKELGGLAVAIEHRYFGESLPLGVNASWTNDGLRFLTLDNVMADSVEFVGQLRNNYTGTGQSPVLVASGSYGGFLAAAFRQNHPETFFGAIAAAAPVRGFYNGTPADASTWYQYANRQYLDRSTEASDKIANATAWLSEQLSSNATAAALKTKLGLCSAPTSTPADGLLLFQLLQSIWTASLEYNYALARPGRGPVAYAFERTINATLAARDGDAAEVLNSTLWTWFGSFDPAPACVNYANSTWWKGYIAPGIQAVPFGYISCTYVPMISSRYMPNGTIFGPPFDNNPNEPVACARYGVAPMTQDEVGTRYHLTPAELRNSSRIVFSEAQYDPTTGAGPDPWQSGTDKCASRYLFVGDMAHREDLFRPDPTDKKTVVQARNTELQLFKQWIKYCKPDSPVGPGCK